MSASCRQMMDTAIKEQREFIGPVKPFTFEELWKAADEIGIPVNEAPPEAIAALLRFGGFVCNMIEQDPSKN